MRIATRTIATKNREIQLLQAQVAAGGSDPTLITRLAAAEAERDAAKAEVIVLTTRLNNASGVIDGSVMVSATADMNSISGDIDAATAALKAVNF